MMLVVLIGDGIEQLLAVLLRQLGHVLGDLLLAHILAQLIVEDIGLHLDQVDDAAESRPPRRWGAEWGRRCTSAGRASC